VYLEHSFNSEQTSYDDLITKLLFLLNNQVSFINAFRISLSAKKTDDNITTPMLLKMIQDCMDNLPRLSDLIILANNK
jgi:hypothetical protein